MLLLIMYDDTTSFDNLHKSITAIEIAVSSDNNLENEEHKIILSSCSVAHHSLSYWNLKFEKTTMKKTGTIGRWFRKTLAVVARSDFNGAIEGWGRDGFSTAVSFLVLALKEQKAILIKYRKNCFPFYDRMENNFVKIILLIIL